jgi:soluble lytic murein transglycosylase
MLEGMSGTGGGGSVCVGRGRVCALDGKAVSPIRRRLAWAWLVAPFLTLCVASAGPASATASEGEKAATAHHKQAAKSKKPEAKAKDAKTKEGKSKEAKAKAAKSKEAKGKAAKVKEAKAINNKTAKSKETKSKEANTKEAKSKAAPAQPAVKSVKTNASIPPVAAAAPAEPLPPELAKVKQAIALVRRGSVADAKVLAASFENPAAQKLVEWMILRNAPTDIRFERYAAFIHDNPDWPSLPFLRKRAEAALWQQQRDPATVRSFIGEQPVSSYGRLAVARLLAAQGDRAGAEKEVRDVWHAASMSAEQEAALIKDFGSALSAADHAIRMDKSIGAKEWGAAMRAATRLGAGHVAVVKACQSAEGNESKGGALLDGIAKELHSDPGYQLCRVHWLIAHNQVPAAASAFVDTDHDALAHQDTDEWWREGRMLARKLLDHGDARTAYKVVVQAAAPANPYYRAEYHFMAGWIALRFLSDATAASAHFKFVDEGSKDPIVLARAAYWRGRAAEAANQPEEMRAQYEAAAKYPTAYYGQLARARLGLGALAMALPAPPESKPCDVLQAADLLYQIGERDLVRSFVEDLAKSSHDVATLDGIGQLAARYKDAQAMLYMGKTALARGLPTIRYAFPTIGIPSYSPIAPPIGQPMVFSIVRTESGFDPRDASPAKAVGLMQVTPGAARDTAQRFKVGYSWDRLVNDYPYNMQMGEAELSALIKEYAGSYIMTFAGYNAGRGRVKQWVGEHGDPRNPKVDAVDWVERIPLAETRNYVQRVMENLLVYSSLMDKGTKLVAEPNLHRLATIEPKTVPAPELRPTLAGDSKPVPAPDAKLEAKAVPAPEAKTPPVSEAKAAPAPDVKAAPVSEAKAEAAPEVKAVQVSEPKTAPAAIEATAATASDAKAAFAYDAKTAPVSEAKATPPSELQVVPPLPSKAQAMPAALVEATAPDPRADVPATGSVDTAR